MVTTEADYLDDLGMTIYAPSRPGPWPIVTLVHGAGLSRLDYADFAADLADAGAVVFSADWTVVGPSLAVGPEEIACAVHFASARGPTHGAGTRGVVLVAHSAAGLPALVAAVGAAPDTGRCPPRGPKPVALVLLSTAQTPGTPPWSPSLLGGNPSLRVAVVHGVDDRVISPERSERTAQLLEAAGYATTLHRVAGGHYDLVAVTPASRIGGSLEPTASSDAVAIILDIAAG